MAELTNYTGNAGLGLGSNPNTPAIDPKANLNQINQTARDVMLLDNQNNMNIFNKKVNDRDKLNELILSNQVSTGNILPEYQPIYDRAKDEVQKEYLKWGGNFNDTNGYRKYQEKVEQLKDVAAHAQVRTTELQKLKQQRSGERLPATQKAMDEWYGKQAKKSFWEQVDPYQQMYSFNMDHILNNAQPVKTTVRDPNNPLMSSDVTYFDYQDTLRKTKNGWLNDADIANSVNTFVDKFQQYDEPQKRKTIDAMNNQLDRYNQEVGLLKQGRPFVEGDAGYVTPFQTVTTPQGQTILKEPVQELAAKYALANQENFVTKTPKFNKDLANFAIQKERVNIAAKKLGIDQAKAQAYIDHEKALTKKLNDATKLTGTTITRQYEDFINAIKPEDLTLTSAGKKVGSLDAIYLDGLPQGYQFINGVIATTDKKGNPTGKVAAGRLDPFITNKGSKRSYYIPRYVNAKTGDTISKDSDFMKETYNTWKRHGYQGTPSDMFKTLLKNGGVELILQGKNGSANYTSMFQSAKLLNAEGTTKGEENVMNPPDNIPEDNDNQPNE